MESIENTPPQVLDVGIGVWEGNLSLQLLFIGSKSEGLYPILTCDDSKKIRLFIKDLKKNIEIIEKYDGKTVRVKGVADNKRGHWRISTDLNSISECLIDNAMCKTGVTKSEITTDENINNKDRK